MKIHFQHRLFLPCRDSVFKSWGFKAGLYIKLARCFDDSEDINMYDKYGKVTIQNSWHIEVLILFYQLNIDIKNHKYEKTLTSIN